MTEWGSATKPKPMSVNKVILVGHLGQNPEIKYTPAGQAVCNVSLATNESWTGKDGQKQEKTEWHRIVLFGKLAELAGQYLQKGRQIYLEGKLQTRSWQDKEGQTRYTTEVVGQTMQFLGGNAGAGSQRQQPQQADYAPVQSEPSFTEEDIPF